VRVEPLYEIVPTPYCHQLLSTVAGELRAEARFRDLLAATFPSGSVTGAPKLAAQVVIESLEASSRGAYCGALLVAIPGALDSSVLIRTLEGAADGSARWGTGCGVTFDSEPAAEWLELLLKTSPVLGDGLPDVALRETMRVVGGRLPLVDRHLARLAVGGCGASTLARVRSECSAALASADFGIHDPARLGVTVTPDGRVTAALSAAPSSIAVPGGPRVQTVTVPALPVLPAGAAKPADRSFWDRAHAAAIASGADQALLVTPEGVLVDGSTASVWLVIDGHLFTPPAPPAVAGVARELVFDIARELRIAAEEATLTVDDLASADEVFLSNAVGGVVPARGRGGPTTAAIAAEVEAAFARGDARGDQ
jgi:para-aminobenzoate synthetase/4-amino-4-deoxychorismate lyase